MKLLRSNKNRKSLLCNGFSLQEVVTSLAIVGITVGGIMTGHVTSAKIGDFSAASAAAQQLASEKMEQTRSAKWDTMAYPVVDELVSTNFSTTVSDLDVLGAKGTAISATVTTKISDVTIDPPVRMVTVECVWSLPSRGTFTNSVTSLRSADQ